MIRKCTAFLYLSFSGAFVSWSLFLSFALDLAINQCKGLCHVCFKICFLWRMESDSRMCTPSCWTPVCKECTLLWDAGYDQKPYNCPSKLFWQHHHTISKLRSWFPMTFLNYRVFEMNSYELWSFVLSIFLETFRLSRIHFDFQGTSIQFQHIFQ